MVLPRWQGTHANAHTHVCTNIHTYAYMLFIVVFSSFMVSVSYLEIYQEEVRNLLNLDQTAMEVCVPEILRTFIFCSFM